MAATAAANTTTTPIACFNMTRLLVKGGQKVLQRTPVFPPFTKKRRYHREDCADVMKEERRGQPVVTHAKPQPNTRNVQFA